MIVMRRENICKNKKIRVYWGIFETTPLKVLHRYILKSEVGGHL